MSSLLFISKICVIFIIFGPAAEALECYVCVEQEDNDGKCASTVETCDYMQDRCMSVIRWGSTPYWDIGAPMQYFISKQCADKTMCDDQRNQTIGLCQRIEWKDWQCSECCQGDRCNYYITLGSSGLVPSTLATITAGLLVGLRTMLYGNI